MKIIFFCSCTAMLASVLHGCSPAHHIQHAAKKHMLSDKELMGSHVGISLFDPSNQKALFDHNGSSYFTPASNTKIITCYAALKHLGDSITGMRYAESDKELFLRPTGDPTLLHRDYPEQPLLDFIKKKGKPVVVESSGWKSTAWGSGWSWDDFDQNYMPERSPLPVYGNILEWHQESDTTPHEQIPTTMPAVSIYSIPEVNWKVRFEDNGTKNQFSVTRLLHSNEFQIKEGKEKVKTLEVPFITNGVEAAVAFLKDSIPMGIRMMERADKESLNYTPFSTRALDSVLKPMMHRSDNFFAEQLLLLVSEKLLGVMDVDRTIDSLLRTDLSDLPNRPRWADGSGLSRYNLFTPKDILAILNRTQEEFGMERIKTLYPSGGEGTLSNLYLTQKDRIYAKTGTLSGVVAFSGYLFTNKKKWILFSIMINQHRGNAASIRKKIAAFISDVQNKL